MKTTMNFKSITLVALLGAALAAPVQAQPGPGMGGGMGGGPGMQNAGQGAGQGMGPGAGGGRGMRCNQGNTTGWSLMTPEERTEHQTKMRAVKTYDECKLLQTEHHAAMEVRAKEKGVTLPTPRQNGCDRMKARGFIK
ncbi:hypothetical protein [Propionivibrio sp.]|uniref:hypothetical protein n=1 Tax=Propionivibrio sp. TaxID=2212460 RepID=UPI003BF10713